MAPITVMPMPLQIAAGVNNACAVTPDPVAPEFLLSLNTCTPPGKPQPSLDPTSVKTVEAILEHIVRRLNGPLDPIWDGPDGHDAYWEPRTGCTPEENGRIQADEEWARWCTELMVGTGYGSTTEYGSASFSDRKFFAAFGTENPVVPVKLACQQLCTYAYYSRGWTFEEVQGNGYCGVTAAQNTHLNHLFEGGWDANPTYREVHAGFTRANGPTSPGTILAFRPKDVDGVGGQRPGSHVVFVLRVAAGVLQAQLLDTGAALEVNQARSKARLTPPAARHFVGGNYDNRLFSGDVNVRAIPGVMYVGIGVLKPKSPGQILAAITAARRARPLGFARLAILNRRVGGAYEKDDILYISPRVWMHDASGSANYYISRYLWSLRQTPGYENLEVLWQISHPQDVPPTLPSKDGKVKAQPGDPFATNAFTAARTVPLKDIWGPKNRTNYSTFLTMSNESSPGGPAVLLHRIKLKALEKGQIHVAEGDLSRYHAVVEYRYHEVSAKKEKPPQSISVRGLMGQLGAGDDYLHDRLQGAAIPSYFARW
jgi:hypothetical protein